MSAQASKRKKGDAGQPPNGSFPQGPQPQYGQPPYGGGPPRQPQGGYMWQPGQQQPPPYGNQMAPGPWQTGQQAPPGMFRQSPPNASPPNGPPNNWNGYRGQPPAQPSGGQGRRSGKQSSQKSGSKSSGGTGTPTFPWGQPQQQWPQNQWGGSPPPPQMWQQGQGPPMHPPNPSPPPGPQHMVAMNHSSPWPAGGQSSSPPRQSKGRPRASPENIMGPGVFTMSGMPQDVMCAPIAMDNKDQDVYMTSQGVGPGPDEDSRTRPSGGSVTSRDDRDKGRGSYRCGRCGVPKKGHVCPYQPKLKRRPDEPPPVTRCAAIQVEMDEFMTLRRLNMEIQGYPESYATASHILADSRVVGEPHPFAFGDSGVMSHGGLMGNEPSLLSVQPPPVASQPMQDDEGRSSPRTPVDNKDMEMPAGEQATAV